MLLLRNLLVVICGVFIASGAVSGKEEKKAVGETVSFRPDQPLPAPVTSFTWKHISSSGTVKAIEWEDGETTTPNPRFKGITTLDLKTGQITITDLKVEHAGTYTIDISGKEQTQRFTLTVMNRVSKPVIELERIKDIADVMYLACKYNGSIIWNNSAREKLTVLEKGDTITVKKNEGNPENAYTCTLKNDVSEETSDPVYKKDLFNDGSSVASWLIPIIVVILIIAIVCGVLYKFNEGFRELVGKCLCFKGKDTQNDVTTEYQLAGNGTNKDPERLEQATPPQTPGPPE